MKSETSVSRLSGYRRRLLDRVPARLKDFRLYAIVALVSAFVLAMTPPGRSYADYSDPPEWETTAHPNGVTGETVDTPQSSAQYMASCSTVVDGPTSNDWVAVTGMTIVCNYNGLPSSDPYSAREAFAAPNMTNPSDSVCSIVVASVNIWATPIPPGCSSTNNPGRAVFANFEYLGFEAQGAPGPNSFQINVRNLVPPVDGTSYSRPVWNTNLQLTSLSMNSFASTAHPFFIDRPLGYTHQGTYGRMVISGGSMPPGRFLDGRQGYSPRPYYFMGEPVVPDECSGLSIDIDPDDTTFLPGDALTISGTNPQTNPVGQLDVQFTEDRPWEQVFFASLSSDFETEFTLTGTTSVNTANIYFRCIRANGSTGFFRYGSGVVSDTPVARPCSLASLFWPPLADVQNLGAGDTVTLDFSTQSGAPVGGGVGVVERVRIQWLNIGDPAVDVEQVLLDEDVPPGERRALSLLVPPEFTENDRLTQVRLYCNDDQFAEGTTLDEIIVSRWNPRYSWSQLYGDDEECFEQTGLSLQPSTWVPAVIRGTSCVGQVLFIPSTERVDQIYNEEVDAWSVRPPFALGYKLAEQSLVIADELKPASVGTCDTTSFGLDTINIGQADISVQPCAGVYAPPTVTGGDVRATLVVIFSVLGYAAMGWYGYRLVFK